eukprot:TRINITY_DN13805_c0_g1_i1.p1 TRINITY_DN13805_c0_g1~~TRINITY_DN13805_c0_g1_i1.p1  ORF type:complete len:480 (-),score=35.25 TRINITY_DN13805_c0_g1_i1:207-1601(-)
MPSHPQSIDELVNKLAIPAEVKANLRSKLESLDFSNLTPSQLANLGLAANHRRTILDALTKMHTTPRNGTTGEPETETRQLEGTAPVSQSKSGRQRQRQKAKAQREAAAAAAAAAETPEIGSTSQTPTPSNISRPVSAPSANQHIQPRGGFGDRRVPVERHDPQYRHPPTYDTYMSPLPHHDDKIRGAPQRPAHAQYATHHHMGHHVQPHSHYHSHVAHSHVAAHYPAQPPPHHYYTAQPPLRLPQQPPPPHSQHAQQHPASPPPFVHTTPGIRVPPAVPHQERQAHPPPTHHSAALHPPQAVSTSPEARSDAPVKCPHFQRGCLASGDRGEISNHLRICPFEKCHDILHTGQVDALLSYFKKQIVERNKAIEELRRKVAGSFPENEEHEGIDAPIVETFRELVKKGLTCSQITAALNKRAPQYDWSCFIHHVNASDLSYVFDGYCQVVRQNKRYILIRLNKTS